MSIGDLHIGQPLPIAATLSAHEEQKRECPQGTIVRCLNEAQEDRLRRHCLTCLLAPMTLQTPRQALSPVELNKGRPMGRCRRRRCR